MRKAIRAVVLGLYCLGLWLAFDAAYSNFIHVPPPPFRTADERFHHGLLPNASGYDDWGGTRYPVNTNSLGFRDASVRDVPLRPQTYRVLLIGDSFTEGVGVSFEDSFAGRLALAGQAQENKIEFLNAGVSSYSPVIYYKKIKSLLENGLEFHEVVVLPDLTDVHDAATDFFCIDDDPKYRQYCRPVSHWFQAYQSRLRSNFVTTRQIQLLIEHTIREWREGRRGRALLRSGWTIPGFDVGTGYGPLGVEGGVARNSQNMQALADLLKSRGIRLRIVVYPHPMQLALDDRNSRHVAIWRDFCAAHCTSFIDLFPAFFAERDAHADWYRRLFIEGDVHFNAGGNTLVFNELVKHLLPGPSSGQAERAVPGTGDGMPAAKQEMK